MSGALRSYRARLLGAFAGAALVLAFAAPSAMAEGTIAPVSPAEAGEAPPASQTEAPAPQSGIHQGDALEAPPATKPGNGGGVTAKPKTQAAPESEPDEGGVAPIPPPPSFSVPLLPGSECAPSGVPAVLVPIYQRAAMTYGLGPQGAGVLAAINGIETAFGTNLNVSSAGAVS